jgi:hypothetical protein
MNEFLKICCFVVSQFVSTPIYIYILYSAIYPPINEEIYIHDVFSALRMSKL